MRGFDVTPQSTLALCLVGMFCIVGSWDVWAYATHSPEDTVSNIIGQWASEFPIFTFAMGALAGHLLWPRAPLR